MLKERIRSLPHILQKQFYIKAIVAVLFLVLGISIPIITKEIILGIPCLLLFIYFVVNIVILLIKSKRKKIIVVSGEVVLIEKFLFFKSTRTVWLNMEGEMVKVYIKAKLKQISVGDQIAIYLYDTTKMYDEGNHWTICNYVAMTHEKGTG